MAYPDGEPGGEPDSGPDCGPDDGLKDDSVVLSVDQLEEISRVREEMRRCKRDADKYQLCASIRDDVLRRHASLELLIAVYDPIFDECAAYRAFKDGKTPATDASDDDTEEWKRFICIAKDENTRFACLKTAGSRWGRDVIQHYQWTSRALKFCKVLRTQDVGERELEAERITHSFC
jgi:hypothetical protein